MCVCAPACMRAPVNQKDIALREGRRSPASSYRLSPALGERRERMRTERPEGASSFAPGGGLATAASPEMGRLGGRPAQQGEFDANALGTRASHPTTPCRAGPTPPAGPISGRLITPKDRSPRTIAPGGLGPTGRSPAEGPFGPVAGPCLGPKASMGASKRCPD